MHHTHPSDLNPTWPPKLGPAPLSQDAGTGAVLCCPRGNLNEAIFKVLPFSEAPSVTVALPSTCGRDDLDDLNSALLGRRTSPTMFYTDCCSAVLLPAHLALLMSPHSKKAAT